MSAKSFFKSTAFKCIVVLLSIVLLCSVFLTICNALFYVSDDERLNRALSELYDGESVTTELAPGADALGNGEEVGRAVILAARTVTSDNHAGDWLIQVKGLDGYQNGTVTCWVVIETQENAVSGVGAVSISSNEGQSYIGKITQDFLNGFSENFTGENYPDGMVSSGASYSSTAIRNAVNGALDYVGNALEESGEAEHE